MHGLIAAQAFTVPGILGTLVVVGIILLIGRFLLNMAFKVVLIAAIIAGALWFLGAESLLSLFLV
ncbi:hypothetical protein [Halocatena marina]|uniref:Uncharacterized protein n=1 Tax=Halocatena marina TaxID=2934937 RepID=A0ABD5YXB8_9EURY|nr:hypothetical protein [Halocatena marina]